MPFDYILGVGRTPKITEDITSQPYTIITSNIAKAATLSKTSQLSTYTGTMNNIIDEDYPSNVESITYLVGVTKIITADLKRIMFMKKIKIDYKITTFGGTSVNRLVFDISNDGISWTTIINSNITANTDIATLETNFQKCRFIRFGVDTVTGGTVTTQISFYKLIVLPEELQY